MDTSTPEYQVSRILKIYFKKTYGSALSHPSYLRVVRMERSRLDLPIRRILFVHSQLSENQLKSLKAQEDILIHVQTNLTGLDAESPENIEICVGNDLKSAIKKLIELETVDKSS